MNKRYDNHNEYLYRYCVRSISELKEKIIPFFDLYPLQTYKRNDFKIFKKVIELMFKKRHLTKEGRRKILKLASKTNRKKKRF